MDQSLTSEATGKRVVDGSGNETGIVRGVSNGVVYIEPDPGLGDTLRAKLGWGKPGRHTYPVDRRNIERVTDDGVYLNETPGFRDDRPHDHE